MAGKGDSCPQGPSQQLLEFVVAKRNVQATQLIADLENPESDLQNFESLPKQIRQLWPTLSLDARLIACLWADDREEWQGYLGDHRDW
jgi:hypothetical protein